ncbi:spermatogenesis-associated protein 1-like isoform X4 [Asterias rubens]|uniref:spermatogenesis-associated protein 1-like isoform X4 n=1 Tax=Asterias rubens TaxID=7604 RepID=UPI001455C44D|nr:spermatogenesis-associated protein 1-like isoform X4 [Asterias rubens]
MTTALVPLARPPSEQLVDLHVYLVPTEVWNEKYHSAYNDVISQTISAGFVRVWPELSLYYLRNQIIDQLGYDVLPPEYVFLKSVGRCLTQVKTKQEFELKVKNFIPPQVTLPELFVLEAKRDDLSLASFESQSEQDSHRSNHDRMDIIGGVPPLPLQHLEPRKGVDPASPLKSWRPDTYTNNTNEDSGIAELEYGRQGSNSLDGNDKDGKPQGRGTFLINSREGPEGGRAQQSRHDKKRHQHLEDGTPLPSNTAAQDQERQRQAEAREKQQQDREKKIKEDAAREQEHKERQLEKENQRLMEKRKKEKEDEEERQRLFKARQHEIEKRRQQQAEAKRLKEEDEEREMEEEIRKRQADELKQSRQKSHQDAKRKEREQFTPHSQRDGGSHQQKEQYDAYAKDFIKKEEQFGGNTRQSNRTRDEGVSLADETGGSPGNDGSLGSAGASSDGGQGPSGVSRAIFDSEGERILAQVQEMQDRRYLLESEREELMRFAKTLQSRMIDRRNKDEDGGESGGGTMRPVRDLWKKRYFEEKKKTNPLEEQVNRLRGQLDQQHRKLLSHLEGRGAYQKGAPRINAPPSKKNDHKILIIKTKHSIEDLRRRVENSKMKLTSEIKLRNQAETELRNLRSEVIQRKINVTISTSKSKLQNTIGRDEAQPSRNMATRATGVSITPHGSQKRGVKF